MSQQQEKEEKNHSQDKRMRKRKILMKQKCNYIDHQISLNIQKLDELMNMIKIKKQQQTGLGTINQSEENDFFDEIVTKQQTKSQHHQKQVRKQRRLKFKYSILREYEFEDNELIFKNQQQEDKIVTQTETTMIENSQITNQQELLLEGYCEKSSQKQEKPMKLMKLKSKMSAFNQSQFLQANQIQSLRIQTRYDWINNYLQREFQDTVVKGKAKNGDQIQVLMFNTKLDVFQCKLMENNSNQVNQNQTLFNLTYNEFTHLNPEIQIFFSKHTKTINIIQPQAQQVIKLDLTISQNDIRVLVKSQNQNVNNMQRIMIFKQLPSINQNDQKYKIMRTKYDKMSFVQDVILQGGFNYLITNLCCNPSSSVSLLFNPADICNVRIQKTKYDPWKSYNILCSSFEECSKVFMSQNVFDDSKPLQFLRSNFLDYGLVLEIYQNIYAEKVAFLDKKQKNESHQEDIELLFPQIYTQMQNKNIYLPQQLVIKFFQVNEKPARLYFPQKRVLIGSKIVQHVTIHSTFK